MQDIKFFNEKCKYFLRPHFRYMSIQWFYWQFLSLFFIIIRYRVDISVYNGQDAYPSLHCDQMSVWLELLLIMLLITNEIQKHPPKPPCATPIKNRFTSMIIPNLLFTNQRFISPFFSWHSTNRLFRVRPNRSAVGHL